jgi:hypothetical protein
MASEDEWIGRLNYGWGRGVWGDIYTLLSRGQGPTLFALFGEIKMDSGLRRNDGLREVARAQVHAPNTVIPAKAGIHFDFGDSATRQGAGSPPSQR